MLVARAVASPDLGSATCCMAWPGHMPPQEAQLHLEAVVCVLGGGGGVGGGVGRDESPGKTRVERAGEWTPSGSPAPLLYPATLWFVITAKLQPPPTSNQKRPFNKRSRLSCVQVVCPTSLSHLSRVGLLTPTCHQPYCAKRRETKACHLS